MEIEITALILIIPCVFLAIHLYYIYDKKNIQRQIRDRQLEIIINMMNAPRLERLCESAGLFQLPFSCSCGFKGKSSSEIEKHFDECRIYSDKIFDLINNKRNNKIIKK